MTTYALTVSSPEGDVFCGQVVRLSARGVEGELAVLAGHVPFATPLVACDCTIELENGEIRTGHTDGGQDDGRQGLTVDGQS